jgi:hypothetical protein
MLAELLELKEYIISEVAENADITNKDIDPASFPYIKILPDREMTNYFMNRRMNCTDFQITLKIIVSRGNEIEALEVLEKMLLKLNLFNSDKGHRLSDTFFPEYVDNTYEINVGYNLKLIKQNTE